MHNIVKFSFLGLLSLLSISTYATNLSRSGDWQIDCSEAKDQCVGRQLIVTNTQSKKAVLGVMFSYSKHNSAPHIFFRFSPKANAEKGAAIRVDNNTMLKIPFSQCDEKICEIRSLVPKGLLDQMMKGNRMNFAFFINNKQYTYPISLSGFSEVYNFTINGSI